LRPFSEFKREVLAKQEPLGADFEKIWDENRSTLYETDPSPNALSAARDEGWNAALEKAADRICEQPYDSDGMVQLRREFQEQILALRKPVP
jgi:hypothetical protein